MPFYYVLVNTFKTQAETTAAPLALPTSLYLDNYATVFADVPVGQALLNTFYVTAASVGLMLIVGSMAAYSVVMRASRLVVALLVLAFLVPGQVTLVPLYRLLSDARLVDTLEGLILLYSAGSVFCYFLIVGYLRTVPLEIVEAARIDGAGPWQIYWRIVLPLIKPILITVGVFQTMWVWNDFLTPVVFISTPEKQTLVLQVYKAVGEFSTDWPMFLTLSVLVLAPMVVFFIVMQRWIVSGSSPGASRAD